MPASAPQPWQDTQEDPKELQKAIAYIVLLLSQPISVDVLLLQGWPGRPACLALALARPACPSDETPDGHSRRTYLTSVCPTKLA